ncbi:uncharacterized protein LOC128987659 [Macrosteles quadrilineatus]|uniref:uncharacterized protein LOC128987659 n=1 Tax=Macrosteles quadrilineatus TaxID=74068 RepID=UPI0023E0BE28|nr:uncharacterized protein LOC128987659 [Macrosteles quadrilineatus]
MGRQKLVLLTFFLILGTTRSLVLTSVRIERHTLLGNSSILECHYDLQGEPLYSVKWYKDGNEFFRFLPKDIPPKQVFPLSGVEVDVDRSNATQVCLIKLTLASTGRYRCEVSAEAPSFQTVSDHGDMQTVAIPKEGPRIIGGRPRYQLGDTVRVNCTSGPSRPATQLTWFINGEQANQSYVVGPIRKPHKGFEMVTLGLVFRAEPRHFKRGDLKLKCLATIATVYWRTNEESVESDKHHKSPALEMKDTDKSIADRVRAATSCCSSSGSVVCLVVVVLAVTSAR